MMVDITTYVCECASNANNGMSINDIVTALISIISLLLNILFYIVIAPKISFKFQKKEDFLKYASEFICYLSTINSLTTFDGVPTKVKKYCISIKLLFKKGVAPKPLDDKMEEIFQEVQKRKHLTQKDEISDWNENFRKITHELRIELSKYTGVFK